jgi:hypothetical protein
MDFLIELLFGLLFEAPVEAVMESRRVKTWIKTMVFLLLGFFLSVLFGFMSYSIAVNGDNLPGSIVSGLICAAWTAFIIWSAVSGHKRKWRKK